MKDDLMQIAKNIAEASGGRIRLAFNEDNDSPAFTSDAAHFLKLDGRRVGRDIELYGFMATLRGEQATLVDFAAEVVLPTKAVTGAYAVAVVALKALGRKVYPADLPAEWEAIFA